MPERVQRKTAHSLSDCALADFALADFKVGVDNVIFSVDTAQNRLLVLLVMRQEEPFLGQWSFPGTLVRRGESLEDAAYRILAEKIRARNLYLEQLYTFGGPNRDPRESMDSYGVRYLSVSYFALVRFAEAELIADGVSGIAWYPWNRCPNWPLTTTKCWNTAIAACETNWNIALLPLKCCPNCSRSVTYITL